MNVQLYIAFYFNFLLFLVSWFVISPVNIKSIKKNSFNNNVWTMILFSIVLIHITFRPIDALFGDTIVYAYHFFVIKDFGIDYINIKDLGFGYLTYFISLFANLEGYFGILCLLYILPVYFAFRKRISDLYYIPLLLFVCSLSFWGYGVNGLRNGIATSFVIYAIFVPNKWFTKILCFFISSTLHKSVLLPIFIYYIATYYISRPKYYIFFWIFCLFITVIAHDYFENLLSGMSFLGEDDRLSKYMNATIDDVGDIFSKNGFRWDFVLYSLIPIVLGYIYMEKLKYEDRFYQVIFDIYTGCNAFWLLVMYIPFTNRFAYLSWFLYPIVVSYPLLKIDIVKNQFTKIKILVFLNYCFTYLMWLK